MGTSRTFGKCSLESVTEVQNGHCHLLNGLWLRGHGHGFFVIDASFTVTIVLAPRDKSKFRAGRAFYLCTLLPNGARRRDAQGATWRFAAIA